ncbi:hypothetical protein MRX96_035277 [Rhipicephalus microplus]
MQSARRESQAYKEPEQVRDTGLPAQVRSGGHEGKQGGFGDEDKRKEQAHQEAEKRCNLKIAQMLKVSCQQANRELKEMQSARREHAELTKNPSEYEIHVRNLKQEVADMKKNKVPFVTKIKQRTGTISMLRSDGTGTQRKG